jgi:hypothetical protein
VRSGRVESPEAGEQAASGRAGHPKKSRGLVCPGGRGYAVQAFRFVKVNQAEHRIATLCRVLGVSPSGYHAWRQRPRSTRAHEDEELTARIKTFHELSDGTYGSPRILKDLSEEAIRVGRKRVARLMLQAGAGCRRRKRFGPRLGVESISGSGASRFEA